MLFAKLLYRRRKLTGLRAKASLRNLHSAERFSEMLRREQSRADRGGSGFSLLTFTAGLKSLERDTIVQLAELFRRRLRSTDAAGWLDTRRIGVLLPDTPVSGAWKVADDICRSLPPDGQIPRCQAYFYLSDELSGEHRDNVEDGSRFLHQTIIDELPQLSNVRRGRMSPLAEDSPGKQL